MKMDIRSGYNNIRIHPDDRWKAAFTMEFGLFEPNVMFFGLCNSLATFQAYMNRTFQQEINKGWMVIYMDNILIFSMTMTEHRERTRRVLMKIWNEHLFLKPEKCTFDAEEVEYLRMIIRPGQVAMDTAKTKGIVKWPTPKSVKDVRSFLGFCNFYCTFISHYSDIAWPLIHLTKKDTPFFWTAQCQDTFQDLKECFIKQPVLRNPDPSQQFAVATDASLVATGGVLLQTDENGIYHPCAYLSQSLNPAERNYQIFDRELLAVICALNEWHYYLEGNAHPVIVFTDHKNLLYFHTAQKLTRRQARWQLTLSLFDIELHHVAGTKLAVPDALSHCPDHDDGSRDNEDAVLLPDSLFVRLINNDLLDVLVTSNPLDNPVFKTASDALDGVCLPPMKSALSNWKIEKGVLYFKTHAYIPPAHCAAIVTHYNDHITAGHPGHFKTEELVKREAWWPSMGTYIHKYVEGCALCQQMKSDTDLVRPPLVPIPSSATHPFSQISIDLITDLPVSGGFDSIMVMVDHGLMKGVIIIPCLKTITSEGVAKLFLKHVYCRFGLHDKVISDRGPQFLSRFSKELAWLLDYAIAPSMAYHPQTDGQTEWLNQELETYLRIYCRNNPGDWIEHIPITEFVHNHWKHDAQNASPFFLMMGYEPCAIPHLIPNSTVPAAEDPRRSHRMLQCCYANNGRTILRR
jgi:RNase H-like domain found in reverse transcriptase/Integrase zinc binding domain/Reverse transcriptase (RNA-dependent DNA polymerase)